LGVVQQNKLFVNENGILLNDWIISAANFSLAVE